MPAPSAAADHKADHRADRTADAALLAAVSGGALLALLRAAGMPDPFLNLSFPFSLLWGAVPVVLILAAYLLTAASESRAGIRRQRGALAALTGLAVLSVPLIGFELIFSPFYGLALIALAVRTRGTLAAATGVLALAVSLTVALFDGVLSDLQVLAAFALVAVAGGVAATRTWRETAAAAVR